MQGTCDDTPSLVIPTDHALARRGHEQAKQGRDAERSVSSFFYNSFVCIYLIDGVASRSSRYPMTLTELPHQVRAVI